MALESAVVHRHRHSRSHRSTTTRRSTRRRRRQQEIFLYDLF
jgi:hypothetical protein